MTLPAEAQGLVEQLIRTLGLQALRPTSLEINISKEGVVVDVKPQLRFSSSRKS